MALYILSFRWKYLYMESVVKVYINWCTYEIILEREVTKGFLQLKKIFTELHIPTLIRKIKVSRDLSGIVADIVRARNCTATAAIWHCITTCAF